MAVKATAFISSFYAFGDGTYGYTMEFQSHDPAYTGDRRAVVVGLTEKMLKTDVDTAVQKAVSDELVSKGGTFTPLIDTIEVINKTVLA